MSAGKVSFDRLTRKRFAQVVSAFRRSDVGPKGLRIFIMLLTLMVVISGLNVVNSYVGRDFMSAIEHRNSGTFSQQAILYIVVFAASTVAAVYFRNCEERLGLLWRVSLTRQLSEAYLSRSLRPHGDAARVANPDQRIAEDVRAFTTTSVSFVLLLLNGTFTVLSFSGVLWSISPLLFLVAVLYAAGGSILTIRLGRPLIGLNFRQSDKEAEFRSELVHVKDHAEAVALTHNEPLFRRRLSVRISDWSSNMRRIITVNRNLSFFTTGYNYMIQIIPALIVAPMFFRGEVQFGVITQSAMAFSTLLGAFSLIVTQFQSISSFAAVIARLSEMVNSIEKAGEPVEGALQVSREPHRMSFDSLVLLAPDQSNPVIRGLDFTMPDRASILVNGPNEMSHRTLFHLIAGYAVRGSGTIVLPPQERMMFLPERPYLPTGTLRDVLRVESADVRVAELRTSQGLRLLQLEGLVMRVGLDSSHDWSEVLSLTEQQLVSCVRAMAANPDFIIFDRPGTTLQPPELARVIHAFRQMGQGCFTLGGTGETYDPFDAVLSIAMDGSWTYQPQIRAVPVEEPPFGVSDDGEVGDAPLVDGKADPVDREFGDARSQR